MEELLRGRGGVNIPHSRPRSQVEAILHLTKPTALAADVDCSAFVSTTKASKAHGGHHLRVHVTHFFHLQLLRFFFLCFLFRLGANSNQRVNRPR